LTNDLADFWSTSSLDCHKATGQICKLVLQ